MGGVMKVQAPNSAGGRGSARKTSAVAVRSVRNCCGEDLQCLLDAACCSRRLQMLSQEIGRRVWRTATVLRRIFTEDVRERLPGMVYAESSRRASW
ncbi:hypothetical protein DOTSEDRAFT_40118 [Dothistroma septosporum NZE10]|uniref:Uncharacterized protein n=1 Tax=Dothistroma septosporum (strain NZE10 / CBS 128990) TaxID=675120 RepID=N1PZH5_DOTSN|nr:hypothetical protein DOTSEDRAFT_40118 [Dothistroma septosporum NZE10]